MSSLSVSVTAETQDLEAKLAVAQAQLRAFQAELRNTANAAVQSGTALDDMSRAKLGQLASQVDQAQGRVSYFKASLSELGPAANQASLHASTLTRETRALIAELSRGEFLRAGGTIALLGEHLAELGPAALAGIAGVAAMGAGLAYMIVQGQSAQKALDDIQGQMILVGRGASFSAEAAQGAMDQLEKSFGLSASSAAVVEKEIAKIPIATDATRQAVSLLAVAYAHLNSETPEKAAQTVAKAFAGGGEAALQFAQQLRALTPAQQLALREAQRHSDVLGAQAILTDALSSRLGHFVDYLKQLTEWWDKARIAALTADTAMGQTVEDIIGPKPTMPTGSGPGTGAADQQALDITLRYRDVVDQIRDREKDIKILKEGIKTASGDVLATETHALQVAEKQLQDLKTQGQGSALEQDRAQLVQELALSQGGHQQQLQETVTFWQNVLNTQKLSAKERLQVETELANAQKQLNQAKHADDLAEAQSHQQVVIAGYQFEEEQARTALATGQITLEQEYQRLKDVENRKIAAVIEYLQRKMELEGASAAAIQQLKDQETIAEYEHDQKMLRIDQDYYQQKKQLAEQDLQSEKGILGELTRLESGLVSSILSSRQRLSVSLIQLAEQTSPARSRRTSRLSRSRCFPTTRRRPPSRAAYSGTRSPRRPRPRRRSPASRSGPARRTPARQPSSAGSCRASHAGSASRPPRPRRRRPNPPPALRPRPRPPPPPRRSRSRPASARSRLTLPSAPPPPSRTWRSSGPRAWQRHPASPPRPTPRSSATPAASAPPCSTRAPGSCRRTCTASPCTAARPSCPRASPRAGATPSPGAAVLVAEGRSTST